MVTIVWASNWVCGACLRAQETFYSRSVAACAPEQVAKFILQQRIGSTLQVLGGERTSPIGCLGRRIPNPTPGALEMLPETIEHEG